MMMSWPAPPASAVCAVCDLCLTSNPICFIVSLIDA